MVHLADDLGTNIPQSQQHLGCAGEVVGSAVSFWVHGGLGGLELIPIFEPFQGDASGGEAVGLAGEVHCLPGWGPRRGARYHRGRGFGFKRSIMNNKRVCDDHH